MTVLPTGPLRAPGLAVVTALALLGACSKPHDAAPKPDPHIAIALEAVSTDPEAALAELSKATSAQPGEIDYVRGLALERQGKAAEAAGAYQAAIAASPSALPARTALARVEVSRGDVTAARQQLRTVLETDAGDLQTTLLLALIARTDTERREALIGLKSWPKARSGGEGAGPIPAEYLIVLAALENDPEAAEHARTRAASAAWGSSAASLALAQYSVALHQPSLAEGLLTKLARTEKDGNTLRYVADLAIRAGALGAAKDALTHLPRLDPNYESTLLRGRYEMALNQPQEAARQLTEALALAPANAAPEDLQEVELLLARARLDAGQLPGAAEILNSTLTREPGHVDANTLLAEVELRREKTDAGLNILKKLTADNPKAVNVWHNLAQAQVSTKRFQEAEASFRTLAALEPQNHSHAKQIAETLLAQGKQEASLEQWESSLARFPEESTLLRPYALLVLKARGADAALKAVQSRIALDPLSHGLLLADLYETLNRPSDVKATLEGLTEKHAESAQAWTALARFQQRNEAIESAIGSLKHALSLDPQDARTQAHLATLLQQIGDDKAAVALYESLAGSHNDMVALNNAAMLYAGALNEPEKAVAFAERAFRLAPTNPAILDTLGWALARRGAAADLTRATPLLQRSTSQLATPESKFHYGFALIKRGETERGQQLVREALADADEPAWKPLANAVLPATPPQP